MASTKNIIDQVRHYHRKINRNQNDEIRILYCVQKLNQLPINAEHIKETDIDITVNSIQKFGGNFDLTVNELLNKWNKITSSKLNIVEYSPSTSKLEPSSKMAKGSTHKDKSTEYCSEKISESDENTKSKCKSSHHHHKQEKNVHQSSHREKLGTRSEKESNSTKDHSKKIVENKEVYKISSHHSNKQEKHKYRDDKSKRRIENAKEEQKSDRKILKSDSSSTKSKSESSNKRKRDSSTDGERKVTKDNSETNKRQRLDHIKNHEHLSRETLVTKTNITTKESEPAPTTNVPNDFSKDNTNTRKPDLLSSTNKLEPLSQSILADLNVIPLTTDNSQPLHDDKMMSDRLSSDKYSLEESKAFFNGIRSKTTRTKIYSGVKSDKVIQPPSLLDNYISVLQKDIDKLKYTGNLSFSILKPVLQRATPKQLLKLEDHNPYLMEDSDSLWKLHVERQYRAQHRQNMETWREMFHRCQEEEERKLSKLTETFKQQKLKEIPVRKTQFAFDDSKLMPPRGICRRKRDAIPVAHIAEVSKPVNARQRAMEAIKNTAKVHFPSKRPKTAPLMAKTMKFYRTLPK